MAESNAGVRRPRQQLSAVWLAAGSALAAMVAVGWFRVLGGGGAPLPGDMVGHAAAAEWLRTLPWWDWRGWSDWFFGGQAIGVSYPPLGHAWMRFTHPVLGQMAAVTVGLLVLLPWGALRLGRAVGYPPRLQQAAVAAVLVVVAASANMHWVLSGFHWHYTSFGSWPAMLAVVVGLFAAAWAARCSGPVRCGLAVGVAALLNASVVPGIAVVCAVLVASSGASMRQATRWAMTAGSAAVVVSGWWLVPFVAGWDRLVRWDVSLASAWSYGGAWQALVLACVGLAAVWAARRAEGSRRLAMAAAAGLAITILADLGGYVRPERWLEAPILAAAVAAAGVVAGQSRSGRDRQVRPVAGVLAIGLVIAFAALVGRPEALPLGAGLVLWRPDRIWVVGGAAAWFAVLLWVPVWSAIRNPPSPPSGPGEVEEAVTAVSGPDDGGMVHVAYAYNTPSGSDGRCDWVDPWHATRTTGARLRPLRGLYGGTAANAEFLLAEVFLLNGPFQGPHAWRPHWSDAWQARGELSLDTPAAASAMGARWFVACDADGTLAVTELPGTLVEGATVRAYDDEESWHRAAVEWWMAVAADAAPRGPSGAVDVPVLWREVTVGSVGRSDQPASGVSMQTAQDRLVVTAQSAGWVWLRVPWDPDWRSEGRGTVIKGGPGHLIVWVDEGVTELRWGVSRAVDATAAALTGLCLLLLAAMVSINRRKGLVIDADRPRPVTDALNRSADAVDRGLLAAGQSIRSASYRSLPNRFPRPGRPRPGTDDDGSGDRS